MSADRGGLTEKRAKYWAGAAEWEIRNAALLAIGLDPYLYDYEMEVVEIACGDLERKIIHALGRSALEATYRSPAGWLVLFAKAGIITPEPLRRAVVNVTLPAPASLPSGGQPEMVYSLAEAAGRSGKEENVLLRMAIAGDLDVCVWCSGVDAGDSLLFTTLTEGKAKTTVSNHYKGLVRVLPKDIPAFISNAKSAVALDVVEAYSGDCTGRKLCPVKDEIEGGSAFFSRENLVIPLAEVERIEIEPAQESSEQRENREKSIVRELQEKETDKDVLAALLYDNHQIPHWRISRLLHIGNPETEDASRTRAAGRAVKSGREILAARGKK